MPIFRSPACREYLDLYTKFKLKVREAYAMRLDTITSLKTELDGYRKQLAESYLTDKEITDRLVKEAYDRMQKDIHVAHIMIKAALRWTAQPPLPKFRMPTNACRPGNPGTP